MLTLNGNSTQSHDNHSVAVTGLSCRFPGDGDNLDNFWDSICAGTCMSGLLGKIVKRKYYEALANR